MDYASQYAMPALQPLPQAPQQAAPAGGGDAGGLQALAKAAVNKIKGKLNTGTSAPGVEPAVGDLGGAGPKLSLDQALNQHMTAMGIPDPQPTQLAMPSTGSLPTPNAGASLQDMAKLSLGGT